MPDGDSQEVIDLLSEVSVLLATALDLLSSRRSQGQAAEVVERAAKVLDTTIEWLEMDTADASK